MVTAMEDENAAYLILGIENQSDIHYAMPVRNMLYDAIQYVNQVDEIAKEHRRSKKMPETKAEYLSGFYKTDRILPIITLTVKDMPRVSPIPTVQGVLCWMWVFIRLLICIVYSECRLKSNAAVY